MKLEYALKVLSRRYRYISRMHDTAATEETTALRAVVSAAIVNTELGLLPEALHKAVADQMLQDHLYLYDPQDRAVKNRVMKHVHINS